MKNFASIRAVDRPCSWCDRPGPGSKVFRRLVPDQIHVEKVSALEDDLLVLALPTVSLVVECAEKNAAALAVDNERLLARLNLPEPAGGPCFSAGDVGRPRWQEPAGHVDRSACLVLDV